MTGAASEIGEAIAAAFADEGAPLLLADPGADRLATVLQSHREAGSTVVTVAVDEWKAAKQAELPLRRFGPAREGAPTAVMLSSDPGGNLYVGQVLGPNSGDLMP